MDTVYLVLAVIGAATCLIGSVGVLAFLSVWMVDRILSASRFYTMIFDWMKYEHRRRVEEAEPPAG